MLYKRNLSLALHLHLSLVLSSVVLGAEDLPVLRQEGLLDQGCLAEAALEALVRPVPEVVVV